MSKRHHKVSERGGLLASAMIEVTRRDGDADRAVDVLRAMSRKGSVTPIMADYVRDAFLSAANL